MQSDLAVHSPQKFIHDHERKEMVQVEKLVWPYLLVDLHFRHFFNKVSNPLKAKFMTYFGYILLALCKCF